MNSVVERSEVFFPFTAEGALSNSLQVKELLLLGRKISPQLRACFCKSIPTIIKVFTSFLQMHLQSDYDDQSFQSRLISQFTTANSEVAPLRRVNANIINILISMLFPARSVQEIEQKIQNLIRTCTIYEISPEKPVQTSSNGLNGPTLLVSYKEPRMNGVALKAFVLKWTTCRETSGLWLYHNLIRPKMQGQTFTWVVPMSYWFDFKRKKMESVSESIDLSNKSESLRTSFNSILEELSLTSHDDTVIAMEKIQGGDLGDFARFKYPTLSDAQKEEFFSALGHLTVLDFLLGNNDRIAKPSWLEGSPKFELDDGELEPDPSMIENVMYSESEDGKMYLHPIDNEINENTYSGEQSTAYLQFVQSTLERLARAQSRSFRGDLAELSMQSGAAERPPLGEEESPPSQEGVLQQIENPDASEISYLTTIIVKSLRRAFQMLPNRRELKAILNDLESKRAQLFIERGIRTMICLIKEELIVYWNSDESNKLKKQLEELNPELHKALDVRMNRCFYKTG